MHAGAKGIKSLLKSGAKLASKSGSMIIRNGKIVIKSLQKGLMKGAKKLKGLVDRILQKFKFKKFKLERKGKYILLLGEINPWKEIAKFEFDPKGVGKTEQVGTPPRYGERQISDEEYDILRGQTPTQAIRNQVNKGHDKKSIIKDEVLPGKTIKGSLEADHIVAMDNITRMEGFGDLTDAQKHAVLNNSENFIGLSKSANTSKQSKTYEEWTHYKKGKRGEIEVNPQFRDKMIKIERELERKLQQQIDNFIKLNKISEQN